MIGFTVYGHARPGGSKRALRNPHSGKIAVIDSSGKPGREWRAAVAAAAAEANPSGRLLDGPLAVMMTFYRPRPRSHYRSGRNSHLLRDSAPALPITRPDLLKLARMAEDACTGILWHDDAQITSEYLHKLYGEPARLVVAVSTADGEPVSLEVAA